MDLHDRFFNEGKLIQIPRKQKDKIKLLEYIITLFKTQKTYSEKEVNNIIVEVYHDYAILRRYLVDYCFLNRESDGSNYSVNEMREIP